MFTNTETTELSDESDDDGGFANRPEPEVDERGYAVRTSRAPQTNSADSTRQRNSSPQLGNDQGRFRDQREREAGPTNDEEEEQEESLYRFPLHIHLELC